MTKYISFHSIKVFSVAFATGGPVVSFVDTSETKGSVKPVWNVALATDGLVEEKLSKLPGPRRCYGQGEKLRA